MNGPSYHESSTIQSAQLITSIDAIDIDESGADGAILNNSSNHQVRHSMDILEYQKSIKSR